MSASDDRRSPSSSRVGPVLLVGNRYLPETTGVGVRLHRLYKKLGVPRAVLCGRQESRASEYDGVRVFRLPLHEPKIGGPRMLRRVLLGAWYLIRSVQLAWLWIFRFRSYRFLHLMGGGGIPMITVIAFLARLFGQKTLVEIILFGSDDPASNAARSRTALGRTVALYPVRHAERIVSLSPEITASLKSQDISPERIWERHNRVDSEFFHPLSAEQKVALRERLGIPSDCTVLISVGGVVPRKNQAFLADAVVRLSRPWYWLVVGIVEPEYEKQVLRVLGDHADRAWFSRASVDDVYAYYQAADVYIHGSLSEGNCNAVNEALMTGLPVVVKENGSWNHLAGLTPRIGRIVDTDDPAAFSRAIEEVCENHPSRFDLAESMLPLLGSEELEAAYLRIFCELSQAGD